jgi:hypothetical protein
MVNPEGIVLVAEDLVEGSRAADLANFLDLYKPASSVLSAAGRLPEASGLVGCVGRSTIVNGLADLELTNHAADNLVLNVSHLDQVRPSAALSADSLDNLKAALHGNPTASALDALSQQLSSKGVNAQHIDRAMAIFSSADLNPRAVRLISDAVRAAGDPMRTIADATNWIDGGMGVLPDSLRGSFGGKASAFFLPGSQSHATLQDIAVAAARSGSLTDDLAPRITRLANRYNNGEAIFATSEALIGGDAYPFADGIVNPRGAGDICSACTSAGINNLRLNSGDVIDKLIQAMDANKSGYYDTAIVPVVDGMPQMTAEHVQSLHGFAGDPGRFPRELRGFETIPTNSIKLSGALQRSRRYVEEATGVSTVPIANVPDLSDGPYALHSYILDAAPSSAEGDSIKDINSPHSMYVVKSGNQLTYFDPLKGTFSQEVSQLSPHYRVL